MEQISDLLVIYTGSKWHQLDVNRFPSHKNIVRKVRQGCVVPQPFLLIQRTFFVVEALAGLNINVGIMKNLTSADDAALLAENEHFTRPSWSSE